MSLRVVLYAEGGGEAAGTLALAPAPGEPLNEDQIGPGHILARRAIAHVTPIPAEAITFIGPLRLDGRVARGSTLRQRDSLRRLLTWPGPARQPGIALILLDSEDESPGILKNRLEEFVLDRPVKHVFGVARPEFEAWLIADEPCVARALGATLATARSPESLGPSEAKRVLNEWIGQLGPKASAGQDPKRLDKGLRITIAETCDLDVVARRCPTFAEFLKDLRSVK